MLLGCLSFLFKCSPVFMAVMAIPTASYRPLVWTIVFGVASLVLFAVVKARRSLGFQPVDWGSV